MEEQEVNPYGMINPEIRLQKRYYYSSIRQQILLQYMYYCPYEIPDHKVGIYCNLIGPLAALRHYAFSCKNDLRYFCQNRRTSYSGTVR